MHNGDFGPVLTAMVTPFDRTGRVDEQAVAGLVSHLLENGSDGIVVCGTTGESPTLTHEEKLLLFRLVRQAVGKRGAVLAGTGLGDTAGSIALTREAAALGADGALLVVPPYNRPSQEGLYRHFRAVAESVPELPCMLYNVPSRTARNLEAATTLRLARDVPGIVAIKEASGDLLQCTEILAGAPEGFTLYSGDDGVTLPLLALGATGVVSVTAHLAGRDVQAMCAAFRAGRHDEAARLHARMLPLVRACFPASTPSPAPVKTGLNLLGIPVGRLRLPLIETNEMETAAVRAALAACGLL